jgi:hypothetical protein
MSSTPVAPVVTTEKMPTKELGNGLLWSDVVALAVHHQGSFAFCADGTNVKLENNDDFSFWKNAKCFGGLGLALPKSRIITFGLTSPTVIDTQEQTMTTLGKSSWSRGTSAVARPLASSETVLLFHDMGTFSLNINDGSYTKLSKECWKFLKALVVDPDSDAAYAFHDNGVYKVDLTTGISEKLNNEGWSQTRCAVWTPTGILILHFDAIYSLDVETGKSRKVLSEGWAQASHAIDAGDGTALIFHSSGLYKLSLGDASYTKVEGAGSWHALYGVWATRPEVRCVNRAVPGNNGGALAGAGVV